MAQAPQHSDAPRLPLVYPITSRDGSGMYDARLINGFAEKNELGEYYVYKRAGTSNFQQPSGAAAAGQGCYTWGPPGSAVDVYSIFGGTLYQNGVSTGHTVDTTNGVYSFSACLGSTPYLLMSNGVFAYWYNSGGFGLFGSTSGPSFPTSFCKGISFLDSTIYVMDYLANLWNSEINDPTTWSALDYLIVQIEPDGGVALAKQLVYVIAMMQYHTEVFYDAAQPSGSPLGPVQGSKINYGCISADSVQDLDGILFWLCTNRGGAAQIITLENLTSNIVSTPAVERLLQGIDFTVVYSWILKDSGHKFYVLTIKNANLTIAFDTVDQLWSIWTDYAGNYVPIVAHCFDQNMNQIVQHETSGYLMYASRSYTNDCGELFPVDIYTPNYDGGTQSPKQLGFMRFIVDQQSGGKLSVRHNDWDYSPDKWSEPRTVDLSPIRPQPLRDCGTFNRRAWHFRHLANTPLRIRAVELGLDLGAGHGRGS